MTGTTPARYVGESVLTVEADRNDLTLETALAATPRGIVEHPQFFNGFLAHPHVTSAGLLAVADVAATRYFDLSALRQRSLDPVVTASGDRLRFESFSDCNGVYARLDLLADGIESGDVAFGTTNVDVNPPLRKALAGVGRATLVHVAVGNNALHVATIEETHIERRVDMPRRWLRGFAEVPTVARRMKQHAEIEQPAIVSFLAGLPKGVPGPSYHLVASPTGWRQSVRPIAGAVHLAGTARLSAAGRIARYSQHLRIFGDDSGASAWVFDLPGARFTLLLSPEPYRGFSGEGGLLRRLAAIPAADSTATLTELLAWEPAVDPAWLGSMTGLADAEVEAGLAQLAASGKLGFDLSEQAWFHRELPFDESRAERDNPRFVAARTLISEGAITRDGDGWAVKSGDHTQWVRRSGNRLECTCLWWAKYNGQRGPCKHALAVEMTEPTPGEPPE